LSFRPVNVEIKNLVDTPEAVPCVVAWIDSEWASLSGRSRLETHDRFTVNIERARLPITLVAVAKDTACVGVASLRERDSIDWLPGVSPWICNVYVSKDARGYGIAGQLCRALEQEAMRLGYENVFLATSRSDSLYHRLGYKEVSRVEHGGQEQLLLARRVS
jgi:GNAT superfamily N-acetyltransferase